MNKTVECVECGNEIPARRIQFMPHTRYCVECVEVEVRREIHFAGTNALIQHTENSNWRKPSE